MIWERYLPDYTGVVVRILKEHDDRVASLPAKREQLRVLDEEMGSCGRPATDGVKVRSSRRNDAMDRFLIRKEELEHEIREIEEEDRLFRSGWNKLSEQEQFVLDAFFRRGGSKLGAVERINERYGYEQTKVYELRQDALRRLRQFLL